MTKGEIIIIIVETIAVRVIHTPIDRDSFSLSFAPKYCETMILAPVATATKRTSKRCNTGMALPTAARALSPTYFPITIESTVLYNCWATLPINMGIENSTIRFHGVPTVMSFGENNCARFTISLFQPLPGKLYI